MLDDQRLAHLRAVASLPDLTGTRYRLVRALGSGGMATVYLVEDTALGREAALKVLDCPDPAGEAAARLIAEARLLAGLEHPNLAPVHDVGTLADGRVFYVMKYVRGARLDAWRGVVHDRPTILRLFVKICDAVAFAHAHGVVHRDLKPQNVMVGEWGEALVMDWGVARRADSREAAGSIIGTPVWMAPEQARGDVAAIDARTDVYALGAILHFLLAGRPPFEPGPADERVPRPLQAIVARAMAKRQSDRYATAGELSADVLRFLDGVPVAAYPESLFERGVRVFNRTRTLVGLIAAYLVMRVLILWLTGR
jgi:serine/threonine protein kinase